VTSISATPTLAGQDGGGLYHGIAVSGTRAYLTTGNEFKVLDVSNLSSIATLGSFKLVPEVAKDVFLSGGYAYVAAGAEGLLKVEATTTAAPKVVGGAALSDATKVIVDGDTAYVLDGASVRVFDVSAATPVLVGSKPLPAPAEGFCLDGKRLYVADGDGGLRLLDVTDRTSPVEVGSLVDPVGMGAFTYVEPPVTRGPVHAVAASGEKVYIGIDGGNVVSLDVSDPSAITEVARMQTYGDVLSLSLAGERLYAGTSEKVYAIDASDPGDIFQIGNYYYFGNRVLSVKGSGAYAFAATDSGFYLVDFSDAANPYVATDLGEGWMLTSGVDFDGDVAWVAANDEGLYGIKIPVLRTSGQSRYETAVELSKANWPSASYVVLATGANFADAACAAPLAHQLGGPLLLVHPRDGLTDEVRAEIQRLGADHAVIVGSGSAVASSTETVLEGLGVPAANIKRLAGVNRYDTAKLVALDFKTALGSNPATAFVATGDRFPDALSVSGVAAVLDAPVLLLKRDTVPTATAEALTALGNPKLVAIGDKYSISDAVYAQLGCVARLAGANRYETAAEVAEYALGCGFDPSEIIVTTGKTFPDALVSGVVSAKHTAPILLVSDDLPDPAAGFIGAHQDEIRDITVVGSARSVSEGVEDAIVDALVW
jgi:putative cell wall-binding protein